MMGRHLPPLARRAYPPTCKHDDIDLDHANQWRCFTCGKKFDDNMIVISFWPNPQPGSRNSTPGSVHFEVYDGDVHDDSGHADLPTD